MWFSWGLNGAEWDFLLGFHTCSMLCDKSIIIDSYTHTPRKSYAVVSICRYLYINNHVNQCRYPHRIIIVVYDAHSICFNMMHFCFHVDVMENYKMFCIFAAETYDVEAHFVSPVRQIDGWIGGQMDRQMDGQMVRWIDRWVDRQMD